MMLRTATMLFLILSVIAGWGAPALAQPTPVGIVTDKPNEVNRSYDVPDPGASAEVRSGEPMFVKAFGLIAPSEEEAAAVAPDMLPRLVESVIEAFGGEGGGTTEFQTPVAVEFPQVGDDVYATRLSFQVDTIDIEFGAVVIRDGAWIQILGVGAVVDDGSTITFLEDLVRVVKDRWPNDSAIRVRDDGLRYGGIWDMMPYPEDLPDHLRLDETAEEGPGPGTAGATPWSTASPADATGRHDRHVAGARRGRPDDARHGVPAGVGVRSDA